MTCLQRWPWVVVAVLVSSGCAELQLQPPTMTPPPKPSMSLTQAMQLEQAGQLKEARAAYEDLVQVDSQGLQPRHRLAVVCTLLGDHAAAAEHYNLALQLDPENALLLTDAGYACYLRKEHQAAEDLLRTALKHDPENTRAANNLGLVLGMSGRMDEALETFELVHRRPAALRNLGYVYEQRGEWELARSTYEQARQLDPQIEVPTRVLAKLEKQAADAAVSTSSADQVAETPAGRRTKVSSARNAESRSTEVEHRAFESPVVVDSEQQARDAADWSPRQPMPEFVDPVVLESETNSPVRTSSPEREVVAEGTGNDLPIINPGPITLARTAETTEPSKTLSGSSDQAVAAINSPRDGGSSDAAPVKAAKPEPVAADPWEKVSEARSTLPPGSNTTSRFVDLEELIAEPVTSTGDAIGVTEDRSMRPSECCLVTLREERRLVEGNPQFHSAFNEMMYHFVSAEAVDRFRGSPDEYVPVAGGLDVVSVRRGQAVAEGSLEHAVWFRDRLYLFSSQASLTEFRRQPTDFLTPGE